MGWRAAKTSRAEKFNLGQMTCSSKSNYERLASVATIFKTLQTLCSAKSFKSLNIRNDK